MKNDPAMNADETCAQCGQERKHAVPSKYAGMQAVDDVFCSATCCRTWHNVGTGRRRRDEWEHGTDSGYRNGCRCEPCRDAHKQACRDRYEAKKAKERERKLSLQHGTETRYQHGCRCASCTSLHKKLEHQAA